jgi:thiosulfate/3-mercaptopyruvate sulfurtransferase
MSLPLLLEPDDLAARLGAPDLLVVDLSKATTYAQYHVPGAVHLEYAQIIHGRPPTPGLLPDDAQLSRAFASIGLTPATHVVAYDDEGGGKAARLLWTLDVIGHAHASLLNGGLHAWANEGHTHNHAPVAVSPGNYTVTRTNQGFADKEYVLSRLGMPDVALLDARSAAEYSGVKTFAARAGHIPGAINIEWLEAMDQQRNLRLKPAKELHALFTARGVTPDKEVITYCQTHHRSAFSYLVLKSLGYPNIKGYAGSWSEWGNDPGTPVEI